MRFIVVAGGFQRTFRTRLEGIPGKGFQDVSRAFHGSQGRCRIFLGCLRKSHRASGASSVF